MWKCVHCGKENEDSTSACIICEYDKFMDYISYASLSKIPVSVIENWKKCQNETAFLKKQGIEYLLKAAEFFQKAKLEEIDKQIQTIIINLDGKEPDKRKEKPLMMSDTSEKTALGGFIDRKDIVEIEFVNVQQNQLPQDSKNISLDGKSGVWAWVVSLSPGSKLYIGSENGVMANEDCSLRFWRYTNLSKICFNGLFDTSNVLNMSGMFSYCENLVSVDIESFNTKKVRDMSYMFFYCSSLKKLNLHNFSTTNVIKMNSMFYCCEKLTSLIADSFDMRKVSDTSYMFGNCKNLKASDISWFYDEIKNRQVKRIGMYEGCVPTSSHIYM